MRFLSKGGAWNHVAMQQAIADSGLEEDEISNERTGIVMGSGGPSTAPSSMPPTRPASAAAQSASARSLFQGHVFDSIGDAGHMVQDPRDQLFDLVGLLDLGALYRQRL